MNFTLVLARACLCVVNSKHYLTLCLKQGLKHITEIDDLLKKHIQEAGKLMEQQSNE